MLEAIRDLGLELQIVFNKGAVMVLPAGVNKAFGLDHALKEMKLSRHDTVGVGDAENDHAFLQLCEFSAAVSNALPAVKEAVELVLPADHGAGVEFLIDQILSDDLRSFETLSKRHHLTIANSDSGELNLPPERSFYFRGPEGSLNLRAQNLILFCQIAEGVDDNTWNFHLRNGDYASWFQDSIKDEKLAAEAEWVAGLADQGAAASRSLIVAAIQREYTLAATSLLAIPGAS